MRHAAKILAALFVIFLSGNSTLFASTFTVNTTSDTVDVSPGDASCADAGGNCSLRAAVQEANILTGTDTIDVPTGTYTLTIAGAGEDMAATGDLDVTDELTINGAGATSTIIEGGGGFIDRIFHIMDGIVTNIDGVTIQNGYAPTGCGTCERIGGGIANNGILTVTNSTVANNTAYHGGGIDNPGTLTINSSIIDNNLAESAGTGGGIRNTGTLGITNSTVSNNTAGETGGGIVNDSLIKVTITNSLISGNSMTGNLRSGGGITNTAGADMEITNSTITGNTATNNGYAGAITNAGTLAVSGSTISGNATSDSGNVANSGTLTITNSTITGNSASGDHGGIANFGGTTSIKNTTITNNSGTYTAGVCSKGGTINLSNSIVANQASGPDCDKSACWQGTLNATNSLDSDGSCGAGITADPLLGPLADNGGRIQTHALQTGSPAIDAGDNTVCAAAPVNGVDQRGFTRDAGCDIGAFEDVPIVSFAVDFAGAGGGRVTSSPYAIDCTGSCSGTVEQNTTLNLTATPDTGSLFVGWTGNSDCSDGQVTVASTNITCIATFEPTYILSTSITPSGGGTVTGTGFNCPGDCTELMALNSQVTLTATPAVNYSFSNWTGCDAANGNQCAMTMDADKTVSAVFSGVPDITVTDSVAPVDDLQIPFGDVTENQTVSQTVTVANFGNSDLAIGAIAQANPIEPDFWITNDNCSNATLAPTAVCTFEVGFGAATIDAYIDDFDIPSDDPDESSVVMSVSGTGVAAPVPDIAVTETLGNVNDLIMAFADTTEGLSSATETVTIANSGNADLQITNIQLTGANTGDFSLDLFGGTTPCGGQLPFPIPANDSCDVTVTFTPTSTGAKTASVEISSNDPDENPTNVALSATGLSAVVNNPPNKPALVSPANGQVNVADPTVFEWQPVTDPDNDPVTYDIYICANDQNPYNCAPVEVTALGSQIDNGSGQGSNIPYTSEIESGNAHDTVRQTAILTMILLIIFSMGCLMRTGYVARIIAAAMLSGALLISCGGGRDDIAPQPQPNNNVTYTANGLSAATPYSWAVEAKDNQGGATRSDTWGFTTR